jgi:hypothetical protein
MRFMMPLGVRQLCAPLWLLACAVAAQDAPIVGFVTWTTDQPYSPTVLDYTLLDVVSTCDDTPQEQIILPFLFPFFGAAQQYAWVNANGAVFFTPVPPCGAFFGDSGTSGCSLDTSYKNGILGYATDLCPACATGASVSYGVTTDGNCLVVLFDSVPQFGSSEPLETFRMTFCEDGHIAISWDDVSGQSFFVSHVIVAAVRGPDSTPYAFLTDEQLQSKTAWSTPIDGLYPNHTDMVATATFRVCPVTREWCLEPDQTLTAGSDAGPVGVHLSTFDISCLELVQYGCRFEGSTVPDPVVVPATTVNRTVIVCEVPDELRAAPTELEIWPVAISPTAAELSANHLALQVVDAEGTGTCVAEPATEPTCDSCALCDADYGCFGLQCAQNSSNVFQRQDCASSCDNEYYIDVSSTCCVVSEMDCFGKCGGSGTRALTKNSNSSYICCLSEQLDCAGVCNGDAKYDVCGICSGGTTGIEPDKTGETCIPDVELNVTELTLVADAAEPQAWVVANIEVNNNNSVPVKWRARVSPVNNDAPIVVVRRVPDAELIPAGSTALVQVNVSMANLFSQATFTWEVKNVIVGFTIEEGTVFIDTTIPVYVSATGCEHIAIHDTCAAAPGCIACLTYNTPRSLRAIDDVDDSENVGEDDEVAPPSPPQRRRAFNQMIPDKLGLATNKIGSYCRDGTTAVACYIQSANSMFSKLWLASFVLLPCCFVHSQAQRSRFCRVVQIADIRAMFGSLSFCFSSVCCLRRFVVRLFIGIWFGQPRLQLPLSPWPPLFERTDDEIAGTLTSTPWLSVLPIRLRGRLAELGRDLVALFALGFGMPYALCGRCVRGVPICNISRNICRLFSSAWIFSSLRRSACCSCFSWSSARAKASFASFASFITVLIRTASSSISAAWATAFSLSLRRPAVSSNSALWASCSWSLSLLCRWTVQTSTFGSTVRSLARCTWTAS